MRLNEPTPLDNRSERGRLSHTSRKRHEASLQIGAANADPPLIQSRSAS